MPWLEVIQKKTGMSDDLAGVTLVAFGSAAPELMISMVTVLSGDTDVSPTHLRPYAHARPCRASRRPAPALPRCKFAMPPACPPACPPARPPADRQGAVHLVGVPDRLTPRRPIVTVDLQVGLGVVCGSAMIAFGLIPPLCYLAVDKDLKLTAWPVRARVLVCSCARVLVCSFCACSASCLASGLRPPPVGNGQALALPPRTHPTPPPRHHL